MSAALLESVNSVIPDSIEPVEAYRCWSFEDGELKSLNGGGDWRISWTPGEALTAQCNVNHGDRFEWRIVRSGMTREKAEAAVGQNNQQARQYTSAGYTSWLYHYYPQVPSIEPPDGYGFELHVERHSAPDPNCSCGIYAATEAKGVPTGGNVYGKVKLWGTVVPGENGYRAEFAYPSEFRVAKDLADNKDLLAFGVPIVVDDSLKSSGRSILPSLSRKRDHGPKILIGAVALNVGAALLNLGLHFGV